jgi:hypothetical protein
VPGTDLTLPRGGRIRASASYHRSADVPERVWGLYMDPYWAPTWPARMLPWENMALPHDFDEAIDAIYQSHDIIYGKGMVEVGCQGGIGRTGVVIACWAILDGVEPNDAVPWVRREYLVRAVETPIQEWWVDWFAARHLSLPEPPRPRR